MLPFSLNLQILRKSRGLKQSDLEVIGIKRTTWNNYEGGSSEPSLDLVIKIAKFFDISLDDILLRDLSEDVHLIEQIDTIKKQVKSTPKSTPIGTPKEEEIGVLNEDKALYNTSKNDQNKDEVIASLREIIDTQKELINSYKSRILMLEEMLKGKK
jgi:DNA-binding XRE family transcriptional regulator